MKSSRRITGRAPARPERRPSRRAVNEVQRPVSHYFTISFGGPGAMEYFSSLMAQLSHCSYKMQSTGNLHEISFDTIPARRRKARR